MNDEKKINVPDVEKMFKITMNLTDKRQMLHSAFIGMINTIVHQDVEFLFAGSHVGKRYNQKIDELGICSRVTFYDKITNKPLRRFVLRTPRAGVPESAYVYMHTWSYYNQRNDYENRAIIDITKHVNQLFESFTGTIKIYDKKTPVTKSAEPNKMALFIEEASEYLHHEMFGDDKNYVAEHKELWGFCYQMCRVKKSEHYDIRFNFMVDNHIVFAKVFRYLDDVDKIIMIEPRSSIKNIGHLPAPGVLNQTQLDIISGFLEIAQKYCK